MSNPTRQGARTSTDRPQGRQARHLNLTVQFLDDGRIRVSTPQARGHAAVVRGPFQLWTALVKARLEATIAGYATWRGVRYDLDELTDPTDPTEPKRRRPFTPREAEGDFSEVSYAKGAVVRPDQAHPTEWTPNPDGSWTSPKGRCYSDPKFLQSLRFNRARAGLPTTYEEWLERNGGEAA